LSQIIVTIKLEKRGQARAYRVVSCRRRLAGAVEAHDCRRVAHNGLLSLDNLLIENAP